MPPSLALIARPRSTLARLAERPRLVPAVLAVAATGATSCALYLAATALEPGPGRTSRFLVSLAAPPLLAAFWLASTWMIGAAARAMGTGPRRLDHLAVSGHTYPVLIAYALVALGQAAAIRWLGGAGGVVSDAIGLLSLPLLGWFVALSALAARSVYGVAALSALALALLPYAALSAALLLLILTASALRL